MGCLANISYLYVQWLSGVFELFECLPCRCLKKTASSAADVVDSETQVPGKHTTMNGCRCCIVSGSLGRADRPVGEAAATGVSEDKEKG